MSLRDQLVHEADLCIIDLEFTGLKVDTDRICEVALVRARGTEVVSEHTWLVRPGVPMSPGAIACTGLTDALLGNEPAFREVATQVRTLLEGAVVVAHNLDVDARFLQRELEEAGLDWHPDVGLDTLLMARRLFAFPRNNLGAVCRSLGIEQGEAHRALADARATFAVLGRMCEILDPEGRLTVRELDDLVEALAPNSPLRLRQRQQLRQALRHRRTVWIDYQSTSDPTAGLTHRQVAPWFLREPRVQGWCYLRGAERVFRLDRIRAVEPGDQEYVIPSDARSRI